MLKEPAQENNPIDMDNDENELVDIEWKSSISSKKKVSPFLI